MVPHTLSVPGTPVTAIVLFQGSMDQSKVQSQNVHTFWYSGDIYCDYACFYWQRFGHIDGIMGFFLQYVALTDVQITGLCINRKYFAALSAIM